MVVMTWLQSLTSKLRGPGRWPHARAWHRPVRRERAGAGQRAVESLEDRTLLAVNAAFFPLENILVVEATADDSIQITVSSGNVRVNNLHPSTGPLPAVNVRGIHVFGSSGRNAIDLSGVTGFALPNLTQVVIDGGQGADTITGSALADSILGGHGDDVIGGGLGNDTLNGGDGNDLIGGGLGDDSILGRDGNDTITGNEGSDSVDGGDGQDSIDGNGGEDSLIGGDGADTINGGIGNDVLNGTFGDDLVSGDDGDDTIFGGADNDFLIGGAGNDHLNGQGLRDTLLGGAGSDTLLGGEHDDLIAGGLGDDSIEGDGTPISLWHGNDIISAGEGADTVDGNFGDDSIFGGAGNDLLLGGPGRDFITGSEDDDSIAGNAAADTLFGGGGADTIDGGTGNDLIESGVPAAEAILISIDSVSVDPEGNIGTTSAVFTVTLSQAPTSSVLVDFMTTDGTAAAPGDYQAVSGTLVFRPGELTRTITVPIFGDTILEADEVFFVDLLNAAGATIAVGQGTGTIINDDAVTLSIDDVSVVEGNAGLTPAVFTLSMTNVATGLPGIAEIPVSAFFFTANGTATSPFDYLGTSGTATIMPGNSTAPITINVVGDLVAEPDETFFVNLINPVNATILDNQGIGTILDDGDTLIGIAINNVTVFEGAAGTTTPAIFTISLSSVAAFAVMVDVQTANNTATAGTDYTALPLTTVTIPAGMLTATVTVNVLGDDVFEGTETFFVNLSNNQPAATTVIVDGQGLGVIVDDDTPAFNIVINFSGAITPAQQAAFTAAERRWEQIITADVPDILVSGFGLVDDLVINASIVSIDGPGGILGQAGPLDLRPAAQNFIPATGIMQFDTADVTALEAAGQLDEVILHEMGHVLGFGTIWDLNGLLTGAGGPDPRFIGAQALQQYLTIFSVTGETGVPVENMGGPGTADAHWREERPNGSPFFGPELMTGFLNPGVPNPISRITVASLADLGYTVDLAQADPFTPPLVAPANLVTQMRPKDLHMLRPQRRVNGRPLPRVAFPLDTGMGDASVQLGVDGYGAFGSSVGPDSTDAVYDPIGPVAPAGTVFESGVAIRIGSSGPRDFLTSGDIGGSGGLPNPTVTGDNTTAMSTFSFGGLNFSLVQTVGPLLDMTGARTGSRLVQTYTITNPGAMIVDFELVRYLDGDLLFDGTLVDGGGILVTMDGTQILFETDAGGTGSTDTTFLGITATGGTVPMTDRFEISSFPVLRSAIVTGMSLNDTVMNDGTGDGFVDPGSEFDVTLALRNLFTLAPGASVVYVTETFWGSGAPSDIGPPAPPPPPVDLIGDVLFGGEGADTINGGDGNDSIHGQAGDDVLDGRGGNDTIFGGAGRDLIHGGDGNDVLDGGQGTDSVFGDAGNDTITWDDGDGTERVDGGMGFDQFRIRTGTANDRFFIDVIDGDVRIVHRIPSFPPVLDTLRATGVEELRIESNSGADRVEVQDLTGVKDLQLLAIDLGNGTDLVDASGQRNSSLRMSVLGGNGADTIIGGAGADTLNGQAGHDRLFGNDGNDVLIGGAGVDRLEGGAGNDNLSGGDNRDFILGGSGNDTIDGGEKNDVILGGTGNDLIDGGAGDDSILGEDGADSIAGGAGNDTLDGGRGADTIHGDLPGLSNGVGGDDSIRGGADPDVLLGGLGSDTIFGGDGDDQLFGGDGMFVTMRLEPDGNDFLNGNAGADTLRGEEGNDTLLGGAGNDNLDGGVDHDQLNGNGGNDSLRGGHGNDLLRGGLGDDTLNGGHGEDTLFGEAGNDGLAGHDGNDRVNGGAGADTLHGGDGNDTLRGGAGQDILIGSDGSDDLDGQGGSYDTLVGGDSFDILEDNGGTDLIDNRFRFFAEWIDAA